MSDPNDVTGLIVSTGPAPSDPVRAVVAPRVSDKRLVELLRAIGSFSGPTVGNASWSVSMLDLALDLQASRARIAALEEEASERCWNDNL